MDVEAALALANKLVFNKTGQRLSTLHAFIFKSAWLDQTYEEMTQICRYSDTHLKKVGSALWDLLSTSLEEEVSKKTFRAALERHYHLQDPTAPISASASVLQDSSPVLSSPKLTSVPSAALAEELQFPEGPVELASPFYIQLPNIEFCCYYAISKPGRLVRIKGCRYMGKTSLLARILSYARKQKYKTVALNLQLVDGKTLQDGDRFLQWFCARVTRELQLPLQITDYWDEIFGSKTSCKDYFENYLLPQLDQPLVLVLDEVDAVFPYPEIADNFFALLRSWHEEAKTNKIWQNLRIVLAYSTDAYLPLNVDQSPFDVGLPIQMPDLNEGQVETLAHRHGLNWTTHQARQLMQMVGGHPYLIRLALYYMVWDNLSLDELLCLAPTESGPYNSYMQRILSTLNEQTDLMPALQNLVNSAEPVELSFSEATKLNRMGLIKLKDNRATLRCQLYREYFSDRSASKF